MGRHASGKSNYNLSGRAIVLILALAALIGALVLVVANRPGGNSKTNAAGGASPSSASCASGELALPVAAADREVGQELIDAYSARQPVVRDYCVTPTLVDTVADAAVYIAPNTPVSHQELAQRNRTTATSEPEPVHSEQVGLAGKDLPTDAGAIELASVVFPVDEEPSASALVATELAGEDQGAVDALSKQRVASVSDAHAADKTVATTKSNVPDDYSFTPLGAAVVYTAIPLNQAGEVSEDQSRAGQDFARVLAEDFDGAETEQPVISDLVWAAAKPQGGENLTENTDTGASMAAGGPTNTLFLLDTSDAMAPFLGTAAEGISAAAEGVAADGHQVALWNYSSPLTPGVTQGYRRNVAFTPNASEVVDSVNRFLTGGQPQTREAVTAAVKQAAETGQPSRVVVVTTGTADGGNDEEFTTALNDAAGAGVSVSVVHVGQGQQDQALRGVSEAASEAASQEQIVDSVNAAAGLTV